MHSLDKWAMDLVHQLVATLFWILHVMYLMVKVLVRKMMLRCGMLYQVSQAA